MSGSRPPAPGVAERPSILGTDGPEPFPLATVWSPGVASALTVLVPPSATTGLAGVAPVVFAVGSLTAIGVAPVGVPPADAMAGLSLVVAVPVDEGRSVPSIRSVSDDVGVAAATGTTGLSGSRRVASDCGDGLAATEFDGTGLLRHHLILSGFIGGTGLLRRPAGLTASFVGWGCAPRNTGLRGWVGCRAGGRFGFFGVVLALIRGVWAGLWGVFVNGE